MGNILEHYIEILAKVTIFELVFCFKTCKGLKDSLVP